MTKRMYNTFEFVGKLNFGAEPVRVNKFDSGWTTKELSLIINDSDTNGQFVKINSGMQVGNGKPNVVYKRSKQVFGQPSSDLQIPWEDRLNQTVVNSIPDYMKIVVDLTEDKESLKEYYNKKREIYQLESKNDNVTQEDENKLQELYDELPLLAPQRKEFLHAEDVITYLTEEGILDKYKGKKFKVKGNIEKSYSQKNNKFYTNYVWNTIELVSDDTPSKLSAQLDLFFVKGAEDKSSFKEDKVLYFDTYIIGRDNSARKDVFFPHQVVLNASKLDLENEDHLARLQFIRDIFDVKGKKVFHIPFETRIVRGSEKVEVKLEDLTPRQQQAIKLGLSKLEDFVPKDGVNGATIEETRLIKPLLEHFDKGNDFTEGASETEYTEDDLVYVPVVFEKKEDVKPKEEKKVGALEDENTEVFDIKLDGEDLNKTLDDLLG